MSQLFGLAKREVTLRAAIPWLVAVSFSPLWLLFPLKFLDQMHRVFVAFNFGHGSVIHNVYFLHDFQPFWAAGRLIWLNQSQTIYHASAFWAWRLSNWGAKSPWMLQYFYPPPSLILPILISPFSRLTGFFVWQAINLVPSVALLRKLQRPWWFIALCLCSPALMFNTWIAQLGVLTGVCFIAGLMTIGDGTADSGVLLGALAIKPQAGLLGPIVLLARRQYGAIASGAALIVTLSAAVSFICGWNIWPDYLLHGRATAKFMLFAPFSSHLQVSGMSIFWMARSLGATVAGAMLTQAASAVIAASWCWTAWHRPDTDRVALVALTVALTLLVTPYGYTTDMCGLTIMTAWLAWDRRRLDIADVLIFAWPALCQMVSLNTHMELSPLIVSLAAIRAWKRLAGIGTSAPACYPAAT